MKTRPEDIVFIINPSIWSQSMYPSGVLLLSSYLENKGYPNIIIDSKISFQKTAGVQNELLILDKIREIMPKIVCFSSSHREFDEVVRMNNAIKQISRDIYTIVGGSQPTYRPTDFLDNGFEFVCIGEGELTLYEFVKEVLDRTCRWQDIRGLCWKTDSTNIHNQPRALMKQEELDGISSVVYDKIDKRYFDINVDTIRGLPLRGALLLTSRGCPFSCSYCGCNLIFGREIRYRAVQNLEREIKYLKDFYDIEGVWIVDDTFTINHEHVAAVAGILKRNNILWACQSRVDTINERSIKIMKESGCVQIDFGVESGSQRILDEIIGKRTNVEQIFSAFALARKYKIRTLANFMIGLPSETPEDLRETIKTADRIKADVYIFSIATPLPGTKLYDMVNEEIKPREYALLNWNGSILTEKLNKSGILNLVSERHKLHKKYFLASLAKLAFNLDNYLFFLKHKFKLQRFIFICVFLLNYLKKIFNKTVC